MKPLSTLRSLSSLVRLSASSAAVAPLPIRSSFDQQITAQLDRLHSQKAFESESDNFTFLLHALSASITTQQITLHSLANVAYQDSDRRIIDEYIDYNTKMIDTCNGLMEKIEIIRNYVESLKVVSHWLEGNVERPHPTTLARAGRVLDSCQALERRCNEIEKCGSSLSKSFSSQKLVTYCDGVSWQDTKLGEILCGSMAVTSMVCAILGVALSFKSKRSLPITSLEAQCLSTSWSCSLQELQKQVKEQKKSGSGMMLMELQDTIMAARALRDQIIKHRKQSEVELDVEKLKRNCGNLEERIKPFEERLRELYKQLINVRMALLGKLSQI